MQDIEPPKRSIRNVPLPRKRKKRVQQAQREQNTQRGPSSSAAEGTRSETSHTKQTPRTKRTEQTKKLRGRRRWWIWGVAVLVVGGAVFAFSSLFASATVTVSPKTQERTIDTQLTAQHSGSQDGNGDVMYDVVELSATEGAVVTATSTRESSKKAQGVITIHNNHSTESMTFVPQTRFQSSDGLIYKTQRAVTIPGKQSNGNPGTVSATVIAAEPGHRYNRESGRFTVPGLKGDPSYESVYAEVNEPIRGGAAGTRKHVSEKVRARTYESLKEEIRTALQDKLKMETPDDFIAFDDLYTIEYTVEEQRDAGENKVELRQTGTLRAPIFPKQEMAQSLIGTTTPGQEHVTLDSVEKLDAEVAKPFKLEEVTSFALQLTGTARFVWNINNDALTDALLGLDKDAVERKLKEFPSVARARLVLQPFWKQHLPETAENITIKNTYTTQ